MPAVGGWWKMSARYVVRLQWEPPIVMHVRFTTRRRDVTNYAILLTTVRQGKVLSVRLYDGAHGINEMHRYRRDQRKQPPEIFHGGTLGEGMRAATDQIERTYQSMIEGWQSQ